MIPKVWVVAPCFVSGLFLSEAPPMAGAQERTDRVILITLDGLRWQELFAGADSVLLREEAGFVEDVEALSTRFWRETAEARRETLMPFMWEVVAREGQLYGNAAAGCRVTVTNTHRFSYPGYNEILTGRADDARIDSNDKVPNPNVTILEHVARDPEFRGRVAAFGSWDVFPYIVNAARSGVPVNAGFDTAAGPDLTGRERFLNELQAQVPSPWSTVRLDAFTHGYALEHLRHRRPRLLYVAYGETDDFAHDGDYAAYLHAARRTDGFIRELWEWTQSDPQYRGRTTFVITTDHGRGVGAAWRGHGSVVAGSDAIWIAVLGPDTEPRGEVESCELYQNQVAPTVAELLGVALGTDWRPAGEPIADALSSSGSPRHPE